MNNLINLFLRDFTLKVLIFILVSMIFSVAYAADPLKEGDPLMGRKSWSENCMRCHNMRHIPELSDTQWVPVVSHMRVRAGLTGQEARNILAFLQSSNSKSAVVHPASVMPAAHTESSSEKEAYEKSCSSCHGADGKGAFSGVPDFTDEVSRLSKSNNELFSSVVNGYASEGSSMPMPARAGNPNLSDNEIKAAISYIKEVFGGYSSPD